MNVYIEPNALPLFPDVPHDIMFRLNPPETSHASSWMTGPLHRFAGDFHNCVFVNCDTTAALKRSVPPPRGDGEPLQEPPKNAIKKTFNIWIYRVLKRGLKASSHLQKLTREEKHHLKKQDFMLGRNLNIKIATNQFQVAQLVQCMNNSHTDLFLRKGKVQEKRF